MSPSALPTPLALKFPDDDDGDVLAVGVVVGGDDVVAVADVVVHAVVVVVSGGGGVVAVVVVVAVVAAVVAVDLSLGDVSGRLKRRLSCLFSSSSLFPSSLFLTARGGRTQSKSQRGKSSSELPPSSFPLSLGAQ